MTRLRLWIAGLLERHRFERDLSDELAFHLRKRTEHWEREGLDPSEARRRARLEFGNLERVKQEVRDTRFGLWLEQMRQDVHHAMRSLQRSPGSGLVVVLSLAVGIGLNTTMFSLVDAMLLRPLPYQDADRLVWVERVDPADSSGSVSPTGREHLAWRERSELFEAAAYAGYGVSRALGSEGRATERLRAGIVGPELFPLLGVEPFLGRHFVPGEGPPDGEPVVMLSYDVWQRRFGGDPEVVGSVVTVDGAEAVLVGVMPPGFVFTRQRGEADLWIASQVSGPATRSAMVARLAPGVTPSRARAALAAHAVQDPEVAPGEHWPVNVVPLLMSRYFMRDSRATLLILWAAAGVVLLVAYANMAGLQLVRALSQRQDLALRMALGASRRRIVRLLAAEGLVLALAGGVLGALLSVWGVRALRHLNPDEILQGMPASFPRLAEASVDARSLAYALLLALVAVVPSTVLPALRAMRHASHGSWKHASGHAALGPAGLVWGRVLVVAQIAFAFVLLASAGVLGHSMLNLWRVDLGFEPEGVLTVQTQLEVERYLEQSTSADAGRPDVSPSVDAFYQRALERLASMSGVESAGGVSVLPLGHYRESRSFSIEGRSPPPAPDPRRDRWRGGFYQPSPFHGSAEYKTVIGDYFSVMGIPVLRGRAPTAADTADAPWVVVINESTAVRYWPDADPIGQRITIVGHVFREPTPGERPRRIVGIVADARQWSPQSEPHPVIYVPVAQQPAATLTVGRRADGPQRPMRMSFVLKTARDPMQWAEQARAAVPEVDPEQALPEVASMGDVVSPWLAGPRFFTLLAFLFGGSTVLLAVVGIYDLLAYAVTQRTHEIGVRMALGAGRSGVIRLVLRQGLALAVLGAGLGLPVALWFARWVPALTFDAWGGEDALFGVGPNDPFTFAVVAALMLGVAALACYRPARRATGVDPMIALRAE